MLRSIERTAGMHLEVLEGVGRGEERVPVRVVDNAGVNCPHDVAKAVRIHASAVYSCLAGHREGYRHGLRGGHGRCDLRRGTHDSVGETSRRGSRRDGGDQCRRVRGTDSRVGERCGDGVAAGAARNGVLDAESSGTRLQTTVSIADGHVNFVAKGHRCSGCHLTVEQVNADHVERASLQLRVRSNNQLLVSVAHDRNGTGTCRQQRNADAPCDSGHPEDGRLSDDAPYVTVECVVLHRD